MKLVHVTDCYLPRVGGIEVQVHDLARRQAAMGHDVTVITTTAGGSGGDEDGRVLRPRFRRDHHQAGDIRYWTSLQGRQMLRDERFDAVHAHCSMISPLAFLSVQAAVHRRIPVAVTLHSLLDYAAPLYRLGERVVGFGDWPIAWSAVSSTAAAPLRKLLGDRAQVSILPNGIDPQQWATDPLPRPASEITMVAVMRLAPRKRPLHLLRVARQVRRRLDPSIGLTLQIIGEGPERARLERYLARHAMTGWVHLPGNLPRECIHAIYGRTDVFIAPATLESFGTAALEAHCAGLPVVARGGTGVAEFVTHNRDGMIVNSDDEMARVLLTLAESPAMRQRPDRHGCPPPPGVTWPEVVASCDLLYEKAAALQGASPPIPAVRVRQPASRVGQP